jgi:hypothetical protein
MPDSFTMIFKTQEIIRPVGLTGTSEKGRGFG